jgi:hexosaminidase
MKRTLFTYLAASIIGLNTASHAEGLNLIPKPISVQSDTSKSFQINSSITVDCPAEFAESLKAALPGFDLKASQDAQLTVTKSASITEREGYKLTVNQNGIHIEASSSAGAHHAAQTLRQLMPAEVFSGKNISSSIELPYVKITDAPRFGWRGIMLDSSRHFQTIEEVRRFVDNLAAHKFNVFHWHLTDSHGWRFESKKYPELTEVGAWRKQPGYPIKGQTNQYGGFYTQEEMKEMVAYAKTRGITIIPEIDMPGHSFSAVASYPHLGCQQKPQHVDYFYEYPTRAQKFPSRRGYTDVLCASREDTLKFCKDILDEVMEIFPAKFIHIGGDEVEKHNWKHCETCQAFIKEEKLKGEDGLQSWFIQQLDNYITSKGKRLIGWDEILQGGLAKNATVMSWQGEKGGIRAAQMGHDVVMSPQTYIYLDHGQSHSPLEPPHWPGHKPLKRVYSYEPIPPQLNAKEAKHILGVQANVWTAFVHEQWLLDICTWPRAAAVAEVGWSPKAERNWDNFYQRLGSKHRKRLDAMGINYWWETSAELGSWKPADLKPNAERVTLEFDVTGKLTPGNKKISFNYTSGPIGLSIENASLLLNGKEVSTDAHDGFTGTQARQNTYALEVPELKDGDKLTLTAKVFGDAGPNSNGKILFSDVQTKELKYFPYQDEYKLNEDNLKTH